MSLNETDYTQLLENLMVNHTDAIYFKDLESRFIRINEACMQKHGWGSAEFALGKTDFDIFADEHAEQAFTDEQHIIATGETLASIEEKEVWPDGRVTWVSSTKMPLRNPEGKIVGTFGISRDITRRKEADLKVKRYTEQIEAISEELKNDVRMAGQLQKSFFSAVHPEYLQADGSGEPCIEFLHQFILNHQVTGDYCSVLRVSDHEAGIFICDIRGRGVRAALGTALIRGIMQEVNTYSSDPATYLSRMNELLHPLLKHEGLPLDVSACYLVVDVRSGLIRMANAGHALPIHFHDGYAARWLCDEPSCIGPALALEEGAVYATVQQTVVADDAVVLFTDGLCNVRNNLDDEYGRKRLLDSAHSFAGEPLADLFEGITGDALAFARDGKFTDDVCMVGFHLKQLMS